MVENGVADHNDDEAEVGVHSVCMRCGVIPPWKMRRRAAALRARLRSRATCPVSWNSEDVRRRKRRHRRRQAVKAVGGGRNRVRTSGGGGVEAIMKGWVTTRRGGATVWTAKAGGGSVAKVASTQDAHLRLSIGDGVSERGVPSASWTTRIRSPA